MSETTISVNSYNSNHYKLRFSNWPNLTGKPLNTTVFDNYVRKVTIPNINLKLLNTTMGHDRQYHPTPVGYRNDSVVTIEFMIDDALLNYYAAWSLIMETRLGERKENTLNSMDYLRLNRIDEISIDNYDNANKLVSTLIFKNCFLTDIGNLPLLFGISEICSFSCNFAFETLDLITV